MLVKFVNLAWAGHTHRVQLYRNFTAKNLSKNMTFDDVLWADKKAQACNSLGLMCLQTVDNAYPVLTAIIATTATATVVATTAIITATATPVATAAAGTAALGLVVFTSFV